MGFTFVNAYRDKTDFNFDVGREKLALSDGTPVHADALYREDTGKVLSVVSPSYAVVTHKEANNFAEELFRKSGLNFEEGHVAVDQKGARFYREFRFPDMKFAGTGQSTAVDYQGNADEHVPTVILRNSFDRSSALDFMFGTLRLVCSNGMMIGEKVHAIKYRHTKEPDFARMRSELLEGLEKTVEGFKALYQELNHKPGQPYMDLMIAKGMINQMTLHIMETMVPGLIDPPVVNPDGNIEKVNVHPDLSAYALLQVVTEIITHRSRKYTRAVQAQNRLTKIFRV